MLCQIVARDAVTESLSFCCREHGAGLNRFLTFECSQILAFETPSFALDIEPLPVAFLVQIQALEMAWLLERHFSPWGGVEEMFSFKAWWPQHGAGELRWSLRRVLPAMGYTTSTHATKVCNVVKRQEKHWQALCRELGFDRTQVYGTSLFAAQSKARHAQCDIEGEFEAEYWLSTTGLILLSLYWFHYKRNGMDRVHAVATTFINACIELEVIQGLDFLQQRDDLVGACPEHGAMPAGPCQHMEACSATYLGRPKAASEQEALLMQLQCLLGHLDCPVARVRLQEGVALLALAVQQNPERWGNTELEKGAGITVVNANGKRARTDPHVKQLAIEKAIRDGRAQSATSFLQMLRLGCVKDGFRWIEEGLADFQAASRLAFRKTVISSFALDAATLRNPAKEMLLIAQWGVLNGINTMLPPQAERTR